MSTELKMICQACETIRSFRVRDDLAPKLVSLIECLDCHRKATGKPASNFVRARMRQDEPRMGAERESYFEVSDA